MYRTQCNDIISNIVFIRMFFALFSNRMISFFYPSVRIVQSVKSCNLSNNASLVSERTRGDGGQTKVDRPGQGRGVPKILKFVRTSFMDDPLRKC